MYFGDFEFYKKTTNETQSTDSAEEPECVDMDKIVEDAMTVLKTPGSADVHEFYSTGKEQDVIDFIKKRTIEPFEDPYCQGLGLKAWLEGLT